jgi:hypothetical protein
MCLRQQDLSNTFRTVQEIPDNFLSAVSHIAMALIMLQNKHLISLFDVDCLELWVVRINLRTAMQENHVGIHVIHTTKESAAKSPGFDKAEQECLDSLRTYAADSMLHML